MKYFLAISIVFVLVGCSFAPSESVIQTAIAQTHAAAPQLVDSLTPTPTLLTSTIVQRTATLKPRPTETPSSVNTPIPQIKLEIGSYTSYINRSDELVIFGEILNTGIFPATSLQVAVSLLDNKGGVLAAGSDPFPLWQVVPVGGKYPFWVFIDKAPATWDDIRIQVQGVPLNDDSVYHPYLDLVADSITGRTPASRDDNYSLAGRIVNVGNQSADSVLIVAVAYDSDNNVVDYGVTNSELDVIKAGSDSPFQLEFVKIKVAPARYELFVQGKADAPSASATPKVSPTPMPTISSEAQKLEIYGLTLEDLPTGFSLVKVEELTLESLANNSPDPAERMEEYRKQGRLSNIILTFERQASWTNMLDGPTGLSNQVIEYQETDGAKRGYDLIKSTWHENEGWKIISADILGDQSSAFQVNTTTDNYQYVNFIFVVQRSNFVTIIDVWGLSGGVSADDAYKLAKIAASRLG